MCFSVGTRPPLLTHLIDSLSHREAKREGNTRGDTIKAILPLAVILASCKPLQSPSTSILSDDFFARMETRCGSKRRVVEREKKSASGCRIALDQSAGQRAQTWNESAFLTSSPLGGGFPCFLVDMTRSRWGQLALEQNQEGEPESASHVRGVFLPGSGEKNQAAWGRRFWGKKKSTVDRSTSLHLQFFVSPTQYLPLGDCAHCTAADTKLLFGFWRWRSLQGHWWVKVQCWEKKSIFYYGKPGNKSAAMWATHRTLTMTFEIVAYNNRNIRFNTRRFLKKKKSSKQYNILIVAVRLSHFTLGFIFVALACSSVKLDNNLSGYSSCVQFEYLSIHFLNCLSSLKNWSLFAPSYISQIYKNT